MDRDLGHRIREAGRRRSLGVRRWATRPRVQRRSRRRRFPPTLVLLGVLIAMVTQVVGQQYAAFAARPGARSFDRALPALSVRDTQDTAYRDLCPVVVGMAVGAGNLWVASGSGCGAHARCGVCHERRGSR